MATDRKVALVTGASSGIGKATASAFIARGYATVLVDREVAAGEALQARLSDNGECTFIRCDVTSDDEVRAAVDRAVAIYGRLDACFNGAGINGDAAPTAECTVENWNRVLAVDLTGVWSCLRHQIRHMLQSGGGAIVNCASIAGLVAAEHLPAYVAAKHGVIGLTKTAALEYVRQGIRVNAVCPGMIDTPMVASLPSDLTASLVAASPAGRLGSPAEIAEAVVWLCDDASSFVTGHALVADGGFVAR
jgi:NAD(P)-dependent dehydrogenase (short-subunit alcohol dehydrogenase family)